MSDSPDTTLIIKICSNELLTSQQHGEMRAFANYIAELSILFLKKRGYKGTYRVTKELRDSHWLEVSDWPHEGATHTILDVICS